MKSVTIAGAGLIGLSCAWRLAQRGWRVTIFDTGQAAQQASWAGAGMLSPGGEIDSDVALAKLALRSLDLYPVFIRELEEDSGLSVEYRPSAAIEVAMNSATEAALADRAVRQSAIGIESEACTYEGHAARRYPHEALTDPLSLNDALREACRARGVSLREHEAVQQVTAKGVKTACGEYSSDRVLIAAGAWSSSLFPGLPRVYPKRGHLLSYEMQPGLLPAILRSGPTYLLQRDSGTIIAGSSMEDAGFDRTIDHEVARDIHRRAAALFPALAKAEISNCWNGLRPMSDTGPVIGRRAGSSVWTAYGHGRNGVLLTPVTADIIAEQFSV